MKNSAKACLILIILSQFVMLLFFMQAKDGLSVDEEWSFGLANSFFKPFLYDNGWRADSENIVYNKWISGNDFFEYLTVGQNDAFRYDSVYYNQTQDTHPPLWYFLLHTVCSFFQGTFSKWYGFSINIVVFFLCQTTLYFLSKEILDSYRKAFLVCFFYGFSVGSLNTFLFIRMYALQTFWFLLITFLNIKYIKNKSSKLNVFIFFISVFLGCISQYHFYIYLLFLVLVSMIYYLMNNRYKEARAYFAVIAGAVFCSFLFFPAVFEHLVSGPRASDLQSNTFLVKMFGLFLPIGYLVEYILGIPYFVKNTGLAISDTLAKMVENIEFLEYKIMFFLSSYIVLGLIFVGKFLQAFLLKGKNDCGLGWYSYLKNCLNEKIKLIIVFVPAILFSLTISPSVNYWLMGEYSSRYYFCILPFAAIGFVMLLMKFSKYFVKINNQRIIMGFTILLCLLSGHIFSGTAYQLPYLSERDVFRKAVIDADCVFVSKLDILLHSVSSVFMNASWVFPTRKTDLTSIENLLNEMPSKKRYVFVIYSGVDFLGVHRLILDRKDITFRKIGLGKAHLNYYDILEVAKH